MTDIKKRDKSKKRTAIIEAATEVFISMGYELASMDKIAEIANVSKKTIYNHFGSKENLFETIIDTLLSERQKRKTIVYDPHKTLKEQLIAFVDSEIFLIDSPERIKLSRFLTITFLNDLELQRQTVSRYPSMYDMLLEWLEKAEEDGKLKIDNRLTAARIFYALVVGSITWPALFSDGINRTVLDPMVDEIIAVFLARYEVNC